MLAKYFADSSCHCQVLIYYVSYYFGFKLQIKPTLVTILLCVDRLYIAITKTKFLFIG